MSKFEYKTIINKFTSIDKLPGDQESLLSWVQAGDHIKFLMQNAPPSEMVIYASTKHSFIYSIAVPENLLERLDKDDLMEWGMSADMPAASYVSGGERNGMRVERGASCTGSKILLQSTALIYYRTFEGWSGEDRNYFELSQEYAHLEELHWRPERQGYCRYDQKGDIVPIVSATMQSSKNDISLITFDWSSLEFYLAASNQVLVRLFDFTLGDVSNFCGWGVGEEKLNCRSDKIFYKQKICDTSGYTRGVQIIRPTRTKQEVFAERESVRYGKGKKNHVAFLTLDLRNGGVTEISTDPDATTNYFDMEHNNLPHELSPAFFNPEVLLKYKGDKDKYTIKERSIRCRTAWHLDAFDVNEADQVFAYICDLRRLPESELLYWKSHNEKPKAPISKRAIENDFKGRFVLFTDPLEKIKEISREWDREKYDWWNFKNSGLIDNVTIPLTASRDEWGASFLALTHLIHERFVTKSLRELLQQNKIHFDKQEQRLSLLEKIINFCRDEEESIKLIGLREAQTIRTKVNSHSAKNESEELALKAVKEHATHAAHFRYVCKIICDELKTIQCKMESFSKNN